MNLAQLATRMNHRADTLAKVASDIKKQFARTLVEELIYETPIDTSQALSNWTIGIDTSPNSFIAAHSPGMWGSTFVASSSQAISLAHALIATAGTRQSIWIANNTPYIIDLNNGSSRQAPAMYIEKTIASVKKQLPKMVTKVLNDY